MKSQETEYGEPCDRCGEVDEDRRTLWHACFYAMHELKEVPFKQVKITGHLQEQNGTKMLESIQHEIPTYEDVDENEEPRGHTFYTLRVCKRCRSQWMRAIDDWFRDKPVDPESCGSGIFIRDKGSIIEITRERWDEIQAMNESLKGKENED